MTFLPMFRKSKASLYLSLFCSLFFSVMLPLFGDTPEMPLPEYPSLYLPGPPPAVLLSEDILMDPPRVETETTAAAEKRITSQSKVPESSKSPPAEAVVEPVEKDVELNVEVVDNKPETDLYARPGDRFSIYLNSSPWLFTALDPAGEGIRYEGRSREENGDRLIFTARETGKYRLKFVLGTSSPEKAAVEVRTVEVVEPDVFIQKIIGVDPASEEVSDKDEYNTREPDSAKKWDNPDDAWKDTVINRFGEKSDLKDVSEWFESRYKENRENYLLPYMYTLFFLNRDEPSETVVESLYSLSADGQREFINTIDRLSGDLPWDKKTALIEKVIDSMNDFTGLDLLLFKLGNEYESRESMEFYRKASRCYDRILKDFPLSIYWDQAHYRRNYIDRHFLLVR